jgi:hypothetical protein
MMLQDEAGEDLGFKVAALDPTAGRRRQGSWCRVIPVIPAV